MSKLRSIWKDFEYKKEALCILPGLLLIFLSMYYSDIVVTSRFSFVFIDSLFDGKFASFYTNAMNTGVVPEGAVYDIGTYVVFAIWALPVWVLRLFVEFDYSNMFVLLYFKVLIAVFVGVFVSLIYKIAFILGLKKDLAQYISTLTLSSLVLVFPAFVAVQYDIIPLVFSAYGLLRLLREDRKGFVLYFAFAFIMKPFAIFTFVLALLIFEKRVLVIFRDLFLSLIPFGLSKLVYMFNAKNIASNNEFFGKNLDKLFGCDWETGINSVSVFVVLLVLIYIGAYITETKREEKDMSLLGQDIVFWGVALWFSFVMFFQIYPYWCIYLMLFLPLAIGLIIENTQIALILDLVFNGCFSLLMIIKFYWVYCGDDAFKYLLLKNIALSRGDDISTVWGMLKYIGIMNFEPVIEALVLGTMIAIVYLVFDVVKKRSKNSEVDVLLDKNNKKIMRCHLVIRGVVLLAWFIVSFVMMFVSR